MSNSLETNRLVTNRLETNNNVGKAKAVLFNVMTLPGAGVTFHNSIPGNPFWFNIPLEPIGDHVPENVLDSDPDLSWRGPDGAFDITIQVYLPNTMLIGAVVLCGHNCAVGTRIDYAFHKETLSGSVDWSEGGKILDVNDVDVHESIYPPYEKTPYYHRPYGYPDNKADEITYPDKGLFMDKLSCRGIRIHIKGVPNDDGYLSFNYLTIGDTFDPKRNIAEGWKMMLRDGDYADSPLGSLYGIRDIKKRKATLSWDLLSTVEASFITNQLLLAAKFDSLCYVSVMHGVGGRIEGQNQLLGYPTKTVSPAFAKSSVYSRFGLELTEVSSL